MRAIQSSRNLSLDAARPITTASKSLRVDRPAEAFRPRGTEPRRDLKSSSVLSPLGAEGDPSGVRLASAGFTISDTAKPHRAATDPMSQPEFSYQEISGRDLDRP